MTGRADERPYEPSAPETGPAVTSANLAAQAEAEEKQTTAEKQDAEPKKTAAKRSTKNN